MKVKEDLVIIYHLCIGFENYECNKLFKRERYKIDGKPYLLEIELKKDNLSEEDIKLMKKLGIMNIPCPNCLEALYVTGNLDDEHHNITKTAIHTGKPIEEIIESLNATKKGY